MSEKKEYVKLWLSYGTYFQSYSPEEIGNLVLAMLAYKDSGKEPDFQGPERFIWPAIRRDMNEARQAQEAAAEQHRLCGQKGGRPARKEAEENQIGSGESNLPPRTKDIDIDKDKGLRQGQVREGTAPLPAGSAGSRRGAAGRRRKEKFSEDPVEEVRGDLLRMEKLFRQMEESAKAAWEEEPAAPTEPTLPPRPGRPPGEQETQEVRQDRRRRPQGDP